MLQQPQGQGPGITDSLRHARTGSPGGSVAPTLLCWGDPRPPFGGHSPTNLVPQTKSGGRIPALRMGLETGTGCWARSPVLRPLRERCPCRCVAAGRGRGQGARSRPPRRVRVCSPHCGIHGGSRLGEGAGLGQSPCSVPAWGALAPAGRPHLSWEMIVPGQGPG